VAGIVTAGPVLAQSASLSLLCSPDTNGGTLVNGVCVLPGAKVGQPYEGFLLTSNGAVDTFTITAGSIPPGLFMPATYGAAGTIVGGTSTKAGTFTFSVHVTPFAATTPSTDGTYSITVAPAKPHK
jgi:putative Ig domain-containing protein